MIKNFIYVVIGAGLCACSSVSTILVEDHSTEIVESSPEPNRIDSIVQPYKIELEKEMLEVIAYAEEDFIPSRPSGSLNNWAADALLHSQTRNARLKGPTFSLLNVGGLRNTINKGEVTLGDMFKIMPFDNEVVWVELPVDVLDEIAQYLISSGGEPIGGARLVNGKLNVDGVDDHTKSVWVITSDYLMNGGDNMTFFDKRLSVSYTGLLLRDVFIQEAKFQGNLIWSNDNRIVL